MKRPGTFTEKLARSSNSMQPTSGGGKSSIVSPVASTLIQPKTLGGGSGSLGHISIPGTTLFTALGPTPDYQWTTVTGLAKMALVYRFSVASSTSNSWQVQVWSDDLGAGEMMFEAVGLRIIPYQCSWPWMYVSVNTDLHIGIKNNAVSPSDFSLVELEAISIA